MTAPLAAAADSFEDRQFLAGIPPCYSTAETRVPSTDQDKFAVVADLVEKFSHRYEVISVDEARVLFGDGWG